MALFEKNKTKQKTTMILLWFTLNIYFTGNLKFLKHVYTCNTLYMVILIQEMIFICVYMGMAVTYCELDI